MRDQQAASFVGSIAVLTKNKGGNIGDQSAWHRCGCQLTRAPACSVCGIVAEMRKVHMDYRVLWRERDSMATLSREECPDPCLNRLLLLFWAHYIEDGPHLLCTGSL